MPAEEANELSVMNKAIETIAMKDVMRLISSLSQDLSQPLLLVSVEGYSYAEVSELLEVPVGTVMSRVHRARKTLATQLGAENGSAT